MKKLIILLLITSLGFTLYAQDIDLTAPANINLTATTNINQTAGQFYNKLNGNYYIQKQDGTNLFYVNAPTGQTHVGSVAAPHINKLSFNIFESDGTAGISIFSNLGDLINNRARIDFYTNKSNDYENPVRAEAGEEIGWLTFHGYDGNGTTPGDWQSGAQIEAKVNDLISGTDDDPVPMDILFRTQNASTSGLLTRMTIKADGNIDINENLTVSKNLEVVSDFTVALGQATIAGEAFIGKATINHVLHIKPRSEAPTTPTEGDIYYDSDDHVLYLYNGTTWVPLNN